MAEHRYDPDSLADRLDEVLPAGRDELPGRPDRPAQDADPLVAVALRLANAPRLEMPAAATARIEAQVLAAYGQSMSGASRAGRAPARFRPAWIWRGVAVAAALLIVLIVGLTPAVAASLPGDLLYPVKRLVERVELVLAASPQAEASTYLTHAARRAGEESSLLARGQFQAEPLTDALGDMTVAADVVRAAGGFPAEARRELEARTAATLAQLEDLVRQAEQAGQSDAATLARLQAALQTARGEGALLLPPEAQPEAAPTPAATPSVMPSPTLPPSVPAAAATSPPLPTATATSTPPPPTLTVTPGDTSTATLTPVSSLSPALTATPTAEPLPVETSTGPANGSIAAPEPDGGGGYDCSHPPPDNAPALGWREHCQGGPPPADVRPGQDGSPPGNSGSAPGQGNRPSHGAGK